MVLPQSDPRGVAPPPITKSQKGGRGKVIAVVVVVVIAAVLAAYLLGIGGL
jgi:hypothetical protein